MKRFILFSILSVAIIVTAGVVYVRHELQKPMPAAAGLVEIPKGLRAREVLALLEEKKVIGNPYAALALLIYTGSRNKLQAGEYMFDRPMTIPEVIDKLVSGAVHLRKFTVREGLVIEDIANEWEQQGFGGSTDFRAAAAGSVDLIREFDDKGTSLEGYLFPETYSFPARTTAVQAVRTMVDRFRANVKKLEANVPREKWRLNVRETVILASLVETEAAVAEERPLVASVFLNRLRMNIQLQCDPTVIYALKQAHQYRGTLTLADLKFNSPYNTYVNAGLPPGPITNPGYAALLASVQPADSKYLYFVRTISGRHAFSENLASHNRAVAAYRKLQQAVRRKL